MFALTFLLGVSLALQLSILPDAQWLWLVFPFVISLYKYPSSRIYLALPLGFLWVVAHGLWVLSSDLPDDLIKQDILVNGEIATLPEADKIQTRFVLNVNSIEYQGKIIDGPKRIRLNWYGKTPKIHAGQQWQLLVRLKPAHGMQNPGGFDYEKWLFERGIRATGYVRKSDDNIMVRDADTFSVNHLRENLKLKIKHFLPNSEFRGLVMALAIGDRSEITDSQWKVLTATGTNHLVAISGLHIGLVAGGVYFIFLFLFKRSRNFLLIIPAYKAAAIAALCAAFIYAMLAGFAVPTQRALIMIAVVMLGTLINKRFSFFQIISYALLAVLLIDPFSAMSIGFWLSFIAVAAILYAMQGRLKTSGLWWQWGRVQWVASLALAPILIFAFQSFSLISPLANIVAVPWVSFVTVPLLLMGMLLSFFEPVGLGLMFLVSESLNVLWLVLDYFADFRFSLWQQFSPQTWTLFPAFIGIVLAIAPRGFPVRYLSILFLLPLFLVKPEKLEENEMRFSLLDVGQGLSAVVQTRNHVLVYDTGPRFRSGFNTGESVILPFLKKFAVDKLDVLMISHGDNDHIGGLQSILENISVDTVISGVMKKTPQKNAKPCLAGQQWQWDGVNFEILHPSEPEFIDKGNNGSCVLRVSVADQVILLTGDIEKKAESSLIEKYSEKIRANILIAPHHGSNTSSTATFIEAVEPDWVLFPAGYVNRFRFPTKKVLGRYLEREVPYLTTGESGAIEVLIGYEEGMSIGHYRLQNKYFWHKTSFNAVAQ